MTEITGKSEGLKRYFFDHRGELSSSKIASGRNIPEEIQGDPEKKKLYDVSREFQSLFINMMLKTMRSPLKHENDMLYSGMQQDIFEDMLYDQYGKMMSQDSTFTLGDQIYLQLTEGEESNADVGRMKEAVRDYESNMRSPSPRVSGEQLLDGRF
jgi:Rod binding domain-containing protein